MYPPGHIVEGPVLNDKYVLTSVGTAYLHIEKAQSTTSSMTMTG